jgi:hypothetical protein
MVSKTSIMLGANAEEITQQLLANQLISNWQRLAPTIPNTTRILIIADGDDQAYSDALNVVIAAAVEARVAWRNEDYLTYGNPDNNVWMPPLAIPPVYVKASLAAR